MWLENHKNKQHKTNCEDGNGAKRQDFANLIAQATLLSMKIELSGDKGHQLVF